MIAIRNNRLAGGLVIVLVLLGQGELASAQNNIGGHFGVTVPLFQLSHGNTTSIADNLVGGFPMGITIKVRPEVAFDLEVVPYLDDNSVSNVLFHPGALMELTKGYTFGLRGAFETGGAFGVTPLLIKAFPFQNDPDLVFFVELGLPIRFFQPEPDYRGAPVSVEKTLAAALHVGIAF